ncbi:hypothetical protein BT69DRAFT_1336096 [Atractiella rhizophila]|nr:hypothetical protein BT69DRAFT_1336096 [Atractiella rhizophila]
MKSFVSVSVALLASVASAATTTTSKVSDFATYSNLVRGKPVSHPVLDREFNLFALNKAIHDGTVSKTTFAKTTPLTNAQLLERGFAPSHGGSKRHAPRRLKNFHKELAARTPGPSGTPTCPKTGNIVVVSDSGTLGYVSQDFTDYATFTITSNANAAATFTRPSGEKTGFNLAVDGFDWPFIGSTSGFSGSNWGPGSSGYGLLTATANAPAPATVTDNPTGQPAESAIWNIDCTTGELTVTWTNDDGSEVPATIFHNLSFGDLDVTGDLETFVNVYGDVTDTVSFFLVEA